MIERDVMKLVVRLAYQREGGVFDDDKKMSAEAGADFANQLLNEFDDKYFDRNRSLSAVNG